MYLYVLGIGVNDLWGGEGKGEKRAIKNSKNHKKCTICVYDIMTCMHTHK